jgi:hypothetical protein
MTNWRTLSTSSQSVVSTRSLPADGQWGGKLTIGVPRQVADGSYGLHSRLHLPIMLGRR